MNDSANTDAQNSNLKKRTKQLSAAARAMQTRKRDMQEFQQRVVTEYE